MFISFSWWQSRRYKNRELFDFGRNLLMRTNVVEIKIFNWFPKTYQRILFCPICNGRIIWKFWNFMLKMVQHDHNTFEKIQSKLCWIIKVYFELIFIESLQFPFSAWFLIFQFYIYPFCQPDQNKCRASRYNFVLSEFLWGANALVGRRWNGSEPAEANILFHRAAFSGRN